MYRGHELIRSDIYKYIKEALRLIDSLSENEKIIMSLIRSDVGEKYSLASKIQDIEELPIKKFSGIQKLIFSGGAFIRLAPVSIDDTTFNIVSTPFEKRLSTLYSLIMFLGPITGLILSFAFSWYWFFLVLLAPIISMKLLKRIYRRVLFKAAVNSEIVFSYLFTVGKITIELPEYGVLYRNPG